MLGGYIWASVDLIKRAHSDSELHTVANYHELYDSETGVTVYIGNDSGLSAVQQKPSKPMDQLVVKSFDGVNRSFDRKNDVVIYEYCSSNFFASCGVSAIKLRY